MIEPRKFDVLRRLRERRESRARGEWLACRRGEEQKRDEVRQAQAVLDEQRAARAAFAARIASPGGGIRAADQLAGRACLVRKDGEVKQCTEKVKQAEGALAKAAELTHAARAKLNAANASTRKVERCIERSLDLERDRRLADEEAVLDDETETFVTARDASARRDDAAQEAP